ncbi:MAG: CarD family transcriptional regulator [Patescibacteria group bacterium]
MKFNIGDRVVYPMHGAGVIEAIEEREISGAKQDYYVIRLPLGEMKVMVPCQNVQELGLRIIISQNQVEDVLTVLQGKGAAMSSNWSHRYRANLDKIRTGDIFEVAEVVRNLSAREREKGLSSGERRMLENARQILYSELALAGDLAREQVEEMVSRCLA